METITEDYVSFETAKLLKEKGFDEYCYKFYDYNDKKIYREELPCCNSRSDDYTAPTLQMAMKWLREMHNLVVNPVTTSVGVRDCGEWEADIYYRDSGIDATVNACGHIYRKTYEEACDAGISYCLENLI